jgi:hypothetical protein
MKTPVAILATRMKQLPRQHRRAHLRALISRESICSIRRVELVALLRHEMTAQPGKENCGT